MKLGTKASVLAINTDGSYQLRAGIMQITAKPEEVYLLENETQNAAKKVIAGKVRELKAAAQPELDIRGRGDRNATLLLLLHPVHGRGAFVRFAESVVDTGVEQDTLSRRGLASPSLLGGEGDECWFFLHVCLFMSYTSCLL